MNDAQRQRAFLLAAVVLITACALVGLTAARQRGRGGGRSLTRSAMPGAAAGPTLSAAHRAVVVGGPARAAVPTQTGSTSVPWSRGAEPRPPATPASGSSPAGASAVLTVAKRFASAFAHYEVDQLSVAVRRELQATATPAFALELLSAPPSPPARLSTPRRATVVSVALGGAGTRSGAEVVVELKRATTLTSLTLLLVQHGGQWRVSNLA